MSPSLPPRATFAWSACLALASLAIGCQDAIPPYAEAVLVVDTDLPVPLLAGALRVDVYDVSGNWLHSRAVTRTDPVDWPASFSIFSPDETRDTDVLVRLRAWPLGRERDYSGERYAPRGTFQDTPAPSSVEEMCANPPTLMPGVPLVQRRGNKPFLTVSTGGDCFRYISSAGSTAARVVIATEGDYRFAVLGTLPDWLDAAGRILYAQVTLQLRRACDDNVSGITCDTGISTSGATWERANFEVHLLPGEYHLVTATASLSHAPADIALGYAPVADWPAAWANGGMPAADPAALCDGLSDDPRLQGLPTPALEPDPHVTIDRLLSLRLRPGQEQLRHVLLQGDCLGEMARLEGQCPFQTPSLDGASTCVNRDLPASPVAYDEPVTLEPNQVFRSVMPCRGPEPAPGSVCIAGRAFIFGDSVADGFTRYASAPERTVLVSPFWLDADEVTVGRWREALGMGFDPGDDGPWPNPKPLATNSSLPQNLCVWSNEPLGREDYGLNCISWYGARAYCQFLGGDLPLEVQWERAAGVAQDGSKQRFPWGNTFPPCGAVLLGMFDVFGSQAGSANACFDPLDPTTFGPRPVRSGPLDLTAEGVADLGGNNAEWILDGYRPLDHPCWAAQPVRDPACLEVDTPMHAMRGASWGSALSSARATIRSAYFVRGIAPGLGFRCAWPDTAP